MTYQKTLMPLGAPCWKLIKSMFFVSAGLAATSLSAYAQNSNDPFATERVPEEFRPTPIQLNSFLVVPYIDLETDVIDNVFISDEFDVDDVVVSVLPSLFIRDSREDRRVALRVGGGYETYVDGVRDDRALFEARGNAEFGLGTRTRTFFGGEFQANDTQGFAIANGDDRVGQPLNLTAFGGNAGLEQEFGPATILIDGRYRSVNFSGDVIVDDVAVESGFRDFETYSGRARLSYALSPGQSIYVQGGARRVDFDDFTLNPELPDFFNVDRSSENASVRVGYRRELTRLLSLDVNAGYITQDFDSPTFESNDSFAFDASILWNPTRLTTVRFQGGRSVDTTNDPLLSGFIRTTGSVTVPHELRRNLVLDSNIRFSDLSTDGDGSNGHQFATFASLRYFISPKWSVRLRGSYLDRDTVGFPGDQTRVTLGLRYNFQIRLEDTFSANNRLMDGILCVTSNLNSWGENQL